MIRSFTVGVLALAPLCLAYGVQAYPLPPSINDWMPASIDQSIDQLECAKSSDLKLTTTCIKAKTELIKVKTEILSSELERQEDRVCFDEETDALLLGRPISVECKQQLEAIKKRNAEARARYKN